MSFPNGDPFWLTAAEFVQQHIKHGEKLLAPREFKEKLAQCSDYESSWISDKDYFQWLIIHKGRMSEINLAFVKEVPRKYSLVFANEVFVVFSNHKDLEVEAPSDVHVQAFWEKVKPMNMWTNSWVKLRKLVKYIVINASLIKRKLAKVEMADNQQDNVDYSSLSVDEIKKRMDERFAKYKENAYPFTCLWDTVRAEELNRQVNKRIAPTQGKTILEIGCGIGGSAAYIADCEQFIGTDLSDAAIAQANSSYAEKENFSFMSMDATRLEFEDNKFDVVIAKEVIEHLPEPQKALAEVFRVLKPNGILVVTSPNRDSIHLRVNRMLGYADFKCSFDHLKEFTFQEAAEMIVNTGFVIQDTAGVFCKPYWGIPGIDKHVRHLTDQDPEMVELQRKLGELVGAEYGFCFLIACCKPGIESQK